MKRMSLMKIVLSALELVIVITLVFSVSSYAKEPFVIAASPSLKPAVEALGEAFEVRHPGVRVLVYYDSGLDLRRTIAAMENNPSGRYFIGKGPISVVAPGGDELIDRLEMKYYVLPGTRRAYVAVPLVLVVPESLVDAPASFEALAQDTKLRVAIADPNVSDLGKQTEQVLTAPGIAQELKGRLDVAHDARGVLDHVLNGQADAGIIFGPDAVQKHERLRITAVAPETGYRPAVHSMAMERYCPNRELCADFLHFIQTPDAQAVLKRLGYASLNAKERASLSR